MKKEIVVKCEGAAVYEWKKLKNFQGDLKDLSEDGFNKLRAQIVENGFKAPFFVWKGHNFILDGHQRIRVLGELEKDGYKIPAKLPVVYIIAETEKQAKKDVLGFISEYGTYTDEGLYEFLTKSDLLESFSDLKNSIDIPGFDPDYFERGFIDDKSFGDSVNDEIDNLQGETRDESPYLLFSFEGNEELYKKFKAILGLKTNEKTVKVEIVEDFWSKIESKSL